MGISSNHKGVTSRINWKKWTLRGEGRNKGININFIHEKDEKRFVFERGGVLRASTKRPLTGDFGKNREDQGKRGRVINLNRKGGKTKEKGKELGGEEKGGKEAKWWGGNIEA